MDDFLDFILDIAFYLSLVYCLYCGVRYLLRTFAPKTKCNINWLNWESERRYHKVVKKMKWLNEGGRHGKDFWKKSSFWSEERERQMWEPYWEIKRLREIYVESMETFKFQPEKRLEVAQDWNDYLCAADEVEHFRQMSTYACCEEKDFDSWDAYLKRKKVIKKRMMGRLGIKELYSEKAAKSGN